LKTPILATAALLAALLVAARSHETDPGDGPPVLPPIPHDDPAQVCKTGCAAQPDAAAGLTPTRFRALLAAWALVPLDEEDEALETLLFHGSHTVRLLEELGAPTLDDAHRAHLERELARDRAWLEVRMVNDEGVERLHLEPTLVPLGEKQHLFPENTLDLTPPEVSGTVHRVGVRHLWTRL
jgi:hypothetical protein